MESDRKTPFGSKTMTCSVALAWHRGTVSPGRRSWIGLPDRSRPTPWTAFAASAGGCRWVTAVRASIDCAGMGPTAMTRMAISVVFFDAAGTLFEVKGSVADLYLRHAEKYGVK